MTLNEYSVNLMYITNMEDILAEIGQQFDVAGYIRQRQSLSEDGAGPSYATVTTKREVLEGDLFCFRMWFLIQLICFAVFVDS